LLDAWCAANSTAFVRMTRLPWVLRCWCSLFLRRWLGSSRRDGRLESSPWQHCGLN